MPLNLHPRPKPRRLSPCHRHPDQPLTSLCAPCLRERLFVLNPSSGNTCVGANATSSSSSPSSVVAALPELRRCKTFSGDNCESLGNGLSHEPRRRSCEVRSGSALVDLFTVDDVGEGDGVGSISKCKVESMNLGLLRGTYLVTEIREEVHEESDAEIRVSADANLSNVVNIDVEIEDSKTMKEFIDLELKSSKPARRDFKDFAGSFWLAASVFSRKLQRWKRKEKNERPDGDCERRLGEMRLHRVRRRRLRETQSEVGEYGYGRRSCDTDPRFSLDLARASIDGSRISVDGIGNRFLDADPRCSLDLARASVDCGGMSVKEAKLRCFDPPRASWDGRSNGKNVPRATTPVVSVIENAMATVYGFDNHALMTEKLNVENENKHEMFDSTKLHISEKELMGSRMSSLKYDSSDSFDTASKDMTSSTSSSTNGTVSKKSVKWSKFWNVLGFLGRHKQQKANDKFRRNGKCPIAGNVEDASSDSKWKLVRSRSVSSSRGLKRREGVGTFERNRSAKYSPNESESGLLRFYLTPLRSRTNKPGNNRSHLMARAALRVGKR